MKYIELPKEYAVVLKQIHDDGQEDFTNLVETLRIERTRLAHIIEALEHKGLIALDGSKERGWWIQVSTKGAKLLRRMWPESKPRMRLTSSAAF